MSNELVLHEQQASDGVLEFKRFDSHQSFEEELKALAPTKHISADNDAELIAEWLADGMAKSTRHHFGRTAKVFVQYAAPMVAARLGEDRVRMFGVVRLVNKTEALAALRMIVEGLANSTRSQYVARVKSLLSYAHKNGYARVNVGAGIKAKALLAGASDSEEVKTGRGSLVKRKMTEVEVAKLIEATKTPRDRLMLQVIYAAGLRISEVCRLKWDDVIHDGNGKVTLCILGKGNKERVVLLPKRVGLNLLAFRDGASANAPVFVSRWSGEHMTINGVHRMLKKIVARAGIDKPVSAHWLRHSHATHALDRGATLVEVRHTLGHANSATTSIYLHSDPDNSSGLKLDESVWG